jgi:hypothetical protein
MHLINQYSLCGGMMRWLDAASRKGLENDNDAKRK